METMVRQEEDFGRDLGLMHELAVAGRRAGYGRELWSRLAHNRNLLAAVAREALIEYPSTPSQQRAKQIMEPHGAFIGPNGVRSKLGWKFSITDILKLSKVPYPTAALRSRQKTHVLVAVPSINLIELSEFSLGGVPVEAHIQPMEGGRIDFDFREEPFAKAHTEAGWYLLRREPLEHSRHSNSPTLLPQGEGIGSVALTAFLLCVWLYNGGRSSGQIWKYGVVKCRDAHSSGREAGIHLYSSCIHPILPFRGYEDVDEFNDYYLWPFLRG